MKIYLNLPQGKTFANIKELLLYGFTDENEPQCYWFKYTYHDEACKNKQCHKARRSFEDLLAICQTYFPNTEERELALVIYELYTEINLLPRWCGTVQNMVFMARTNNRWETWFSNLEMRNLIEKGKYCFNDIMYLLIDPKTLE